MVKVSHVDEVSEVIDSLHKTPSYAEVGIPMLRVTDIKSGSVTTDNCKLVDSETYAEFSKRYVPSHGDIVITRVGSYGNVAYVGDSNFCLGQNTAAIVPKDITPRYLYYVLSSPFGKREIENLVVGSTQKTLSLRAIKSLPVPRHGVENERAIAHILGTLDDKIELNQKMNQTLEDIAKAIFKSWFVDFDPVRAKVEGRSTGLPPEISDLFGDELVDSEIGEIPKGWVLASIDKACEKIYSGGTPSTKVPEYWGGSHGWLSSGETGSTFIIDTEKKITEAGIENSSTKAALRFDTVIASAGQGKTRGQTSLLFLDTYVNQSVVTLRAKTEIGALLLFFNLSRRYEEFRRYSDSSSSRGSLTTTLLKELPFVIPTQNLTSLFQKTTLPMVEKIELNLKENEVLSELRDTLLPKLISGELRIPDAEKFLEEAGL